VKEQKKKGIPKEKGFVAYVFLWLLSWTCLLSLGLLCYPFSFSLAIIVCIHPRCTPPSFQYFGVVFQRVGTNPSHPLPLRISPNRTIPIHLSSTLNVENHDSLSGLMWDLSLSTSARAMSRGVSFGVVPVELEGSLPPRPLPRPLPLPRPRSPRPD